MNFELLYLYCLGRDNYLDEYCSQALTGRKLLGRLYSELLIENLESYILYREFGCMVLLSIFLA